MFWCELNKNAAPSPYGYAAGFGVDICVSNNLFVRGEYEYVRFGASRTSNARPYGARRPLGTLGDI